MFTRILAISTTGILGFVGAAGGAELVRLTPRTMQAYAPQGKEVDAIYGDYVLRNKNLVAVVAKESADRNANMMVRGIGGGLIDLTTRANQSDQLGVYLPWPPHSSVWFDGFEVDGALVPDQAGDAEVHRGNTVALRFQVFSHGRQILQPEGEPIIVVRYILKGGASHLRVDTTYINPTRELISFPVQDYVRADHSYGMRAMIEIDPGQRDY